MYDIKISLSGIIILLLAIALLIVMVHNMISSNNVKTYQAIHNCKVTNTDK